MTLARPLLYSPAVRPASAGGTVRFVADVFHALSPTAGTAAGFSIATTAGLVSGTRLCSNEPSHAPAENSSHIPSINTSGSAAVAPLLFSSSFCGSLDFFDLLKDLDRGSWEVLLPEGSSLGEESHSSPGRLCLTLPRTLPKLLQSCRQDLSEDLGGLLSPPPWPLSSPSLANGILAPAGPPKWPTFPPPPTLKCRQRNF
jgi:hypothetical protein